MTPVLSPVTNIHDWNTQGFRKQHKGTDIERAHGYTNLPLPRTDTNHVTINQGAWCKKLSEESNYIIDDEIVFCG